MIDVDPLIKIMVDYLSCMEGKGIFAVFHNSTRQMIFYCDNSISKTVKYTFQDCKM